jgi:hypothetical protein
MREPTGSVSLRAGVDTTTVFPLTSDVLTMSFSPILHVVLVARE